MYGWKRASARKYKLVCAYHFVQGIIKEANWQQVKNLHT
ncbi:hypothetical protein GPUN_1176 [Glaciecola punicea ACAM 611]|uniref:Uncharacterized protein n=1 Tax=Glaciecola punicea ACAM 611 TaxID=1121923 RepID=H5TAH8_9ALTE|nr:hypothetical protein GPUN_1176 [Glaciecola punicea ACAM 611]